MLMRVFNRMNVNLRTYIPTSVFVSTHYWRLQHRLVYVSPLHYALSTASYGAIKPTLVLHFQVLQFLALQCGPSYSRSAYSVDPRRQLHRPTFLFARC